VASDEDATSTCIVRWTPGKTAMFTIKVVNNGDKCSDYCLSTN